MPSNEHRQFVTVVSGLPRSGTSMMMAMLEAGGIPALTDSLRGADEDNRRGYYEFEPVKAIATDSAWMADARGKAVKIILSLLPHLPGGFRYRVVVMQRDLDEVITSQRVMLERAGRRGGRIGADQLKRLYEAELAKHDAWAAGRDDVGSVRVSYNGLLAEPEPVVTALDAFLGGGLDRGCMLAVVEPALYRQRGAGLAGRVGP
ncbi:MAG: hypothetical protein IT431_09780 [Phycisphaerales bacterium]|nr:hypothetical protein [Phycisphaerales bacterium]